MVVLMEILLVVSAKSVNISCLAKMSRQKVNETQTSLVIR